MMEKVFFLTITDTFKTTPNLKYDIIFTQKCSLFILLFLTHQKHTFNLPDFERPIAWIHSVLHNLLWFWPHHPWPDPWISWKIVGIGYFPWLLGSHSKWFYFRIAMLIPLNAEPNHKKPQYFWACLRSYKMGSTYKWMKMKFPICVQIKKKIQGYLVSKVVVVDRIPNIW